MVCSSISSSERELTPQPRQTDCGSAGEADRLCLSETTGSSAATHTSAAADSPRPPHPPLPPPEEAAADICSGEEPKKVASLCVYSQSASSRPVFLTSQLTNLFSDSRFCLSFCLLFAQFSKPAEAPSHLGLSESKLNVSPCPRSGRGPWNQR